MLRVKTVDIGHEIPFLQYNRNTLQIFTKNFVVGIGGNTFRVSTNRSVGESRYHRQVTFNFSLHRTRCVVLE